jgi:CheY-like chemotaxis protein/HPt (histidine-containing phosphotransfer) domain-containing protein
VIPLANSGHILVVDDDEMSRAVLELLLQQEGYAVTCVDSGESALGMLGDSAWVPGVVLADMQMPGVSGNSLATQLRAACGHQTILLAMSGTAPIPEAVATFDGFLLKPFSMEDLAAAISADSSETLSGRTSPAQVSGVESTMFDLAASAATSTDQAPPLDQFIYDKLALSMQISQLNQLYLLCLEDVRKRVEGMRSSAASGDNAEFIREAHAVKGGCGMLGATELYGIAAGLEATGLRALGLVSRPGSHAARTEPVINPLDELLAACDRLERILVARSVASAP